ncbi:MAG: endonuclease/exonuclease/phosphatase family protein [Vibrionaceae bacterium]
MLTLIFLFSSVTLFIYFAVTAPEKAYFVGMQESACIEFSMQEKNSIDVNQPLTVSVWNIYKQNNAGWLEQLTKLQQSSALILLQEAKANQELFTFFKNKEWNTQQTHAFSVFKNIYGVLNASQYTPFKTCAYKEKEPYLRLPKSGIVSFYSLSNGQKLAVVNLHAINFVYDMKMYDQQINRLLENIKNFSGAVIVAGDFNTWNKKRLDFIVHTMQELGLSAVPFSLDERKTFLNYPLDHIFYRGLNLQAATSKDTKASDHAWLQATFTFAHNQ